MAETSGAYSMFRKRLILDKICAIELWLGLSNLISFLMKQNIVTQHSICSEDDITTLLEDNSANKAFAMITVLVIFEVVLGRDSYKDIVRMFRIQITSPTGSNLRHNAHCFVPMLLQ